MKQGKIETLNEQYVVKLEDGSYLSTFHAFNGVVPMTWNKKYNTKKSIAANVKGIWNIEVK